MSKSSKSKIKVPKRVAGVKIPKVVRKGPVVDFVNSSAGRLLIAEALTAAIAAFAVKRVDPATGQRLQADMQDGEVALKRNTAKLAHAFGEAVRAFREALADSGSESAADGDAEDLPDEAPEAGKKKSRGSSRQPAMPGL